MVCLVFFQKIHRSMNPVIPWLTLYFLNFHIVLLHLPALGCGIKTPNTSRHNASGSTELLMCPWQRLRSQPAPCPAGTAPAWTQPVSAAGGKSGSSASVWCRALQKEAPRCPSCLWEEETTKISPLLLVQCTLCAVDMAMPLSAKLIAQSACLTRVLCPETRTLKHVESCPAWPYNALHSLPAQPPSLVSVQLSPAQHYNRLFVLRTFHICLYRKTTFLHVFS